MAIDGKLLAKAKNALGEKRRERERELERRTGEVYVKSPEVEQIDLRLRETMLELMGIVLEEGTEGQFQALREENTALQDKRRAMLVKSGFSNDYLDDNYMCPVCNDTGFTGRKMCDCLKELYIAEQRASLSSLLKLGSETFENFDLSYYDDTPSPNTDSTPRQHMEKVYEICVRYARGFKGSSANLLLIGAPGLGKTFLSACIARVVSDKGHSVVYDTAGSVFSNYEDVQFSKAENMSETRDVIRKYLSCELLILDDLGTETTAAFVTMGALYDIVNTRLITNKKTIINTNLTLDDMRERYSEQIMSRLEGDYQMLTFHGDDIRKKRGTVIC